MATLPITARPEELRRLAKRLVEAAAGATTNGPITVTLDSAPGDAVTSVTDAAGKKGKV